MRINLEITEILNRGEGHLYCVVRIKQKNNSFKEFIVRNEKM